MDHIESVSPPKLLYGLNDKPPLNIGTFVLFAIIYIALTLEVIGDITATAMVSGEPIVGATFFRRMKGGILGDGFNSLVTAICATFPVVTLAQNNGNG